MKGVYPLFGCVFQGSPRTFYVLLAGACETADNRPFNFASDSLYGLKITNYRSLADITIGQIAYEKKGKATSDPAFSIEFNNSFSTNSLIPFAEI